MNYANYIIFKAVCQELQSKSNLLQEKIIVKFLSFVLFFFIQIRKIAKIVHFRGMSVRCF